MSRLGITLEEVSSAAQEIISSGQNPTIEKVRSALGSRGSNSTISKYLNQWRQQALPAQLNQELNSPIVQQSDAVSSAVDQVWASLQAESKQEIEQLKSDFAEKYAIQQQELTATHETLTQQQHQNLKLTQQLNDLTQKNKELIVFNEQQTAELLIEKTKIKELDSNLQENTLRTQQHIQEIQQLKDEQVQYLSNQITELGVKNQAEVELLRNRIEEQRVKYSVALENAKVSVQKSEEKLVIQQDLNQQFKRDKAELKQQLEELNQLKYSNDKLIQAISNPIAEIQQILSKEKDEKRLLEQENRTLIAQFSALKTHNERIQYELQQLQAEKKWLQEKLVLVKVDSNEESIANE